MRKEAVLTTTVTVNKHVFVVKLFGNKEFAIFEDPRRSNAPVARLDIPKNCRENGSLMTSLLKRAARTIISHYDIQMKTNSYGLSLLDGSRLSAGELKKIDPLLDFAHATKGSDFLLQLVRRDK